MGWEFLRIFFSEMILYNWLTYSCVLVHLCQRVLGNMNDFYAFACLCLPLFLPLLYKIWENYQDRNIESCDLHIWFVYIYIYIYIYIHTHTHTHTHTHIYIYIYIYIHIYKHTHTDRPIFARIYAFTDQMNHQHFKIN